MARLTRTLLVTAFVSLAFTSVAQAGGGNYVFDGGTAKQQTQVRQALNASSFNWSIVPAQIKIHITSGYADLATRGELWLDPAVLDSGRFSWGLVQHEYAHEVDFFLFNDAARATLAPQLGGLSWWQTGSIRHDQLSSERFASTLAWSYWQSKDNSLRPTRPLASRRRSHPSASARSWRACSASRSFKARPLHPAALRVAP
jgi:hypothetical protein